jgi:hypothetical protein
MTRRAARPSAPTAVAAHRARQRDRGLQRVEVQVRQEDAALLRAVAAALADPAQVEHARAHLLHRFAPSAGLKAMLSAAPLDDIDLDRPRDLGRAIDL